VKLTARQFRWLPNALTVARMVLAIVVIFAAANGRWTLAFWLLFIALVTDFFDGLAAKKLHAQTKLGTQLDRRADAMISGGGLIGLATGGLFPWWGVVAAPLIAAFLAEEHLFVPKTGWLHDHRPLWSIMYLFSVWTYLSWAYLTQAYGWHLWYVPVTIVALLISASLKRHRLRAWFAANRG